MNFMCFTFVESVEEPEDCRLARAQLERRAGDPAVVIETTWICAVGVGVAVVEQTFVCASAEEMKNY